jgi:hypothetical protein
MPPQDAVDAIVGTDRCRAVVKLERHAHHVVRAVDPCPRRSLIDRAIEDESHGVVDA